MTKSSHLPCPCGKSSDAYKYNEDGSEHCYSCNKHVFASTQRKMKELPSLEGTTVQVVPYRSHSRQALNYYGVFNHVRPDGSIQEVVYPYPWFNKHRVLDTKQFYVKGENTNHPGLFGMDRFEPGCHYAVTVTEGEEDALSVYEMLGFSSPAVSVRSSSTAVQDCKEEKAFAFLNSFQKIILNFDNDEPGRKAAEAVATLFDFNKVHFLFLEKFKDANDAHQKGAISQYATAWKNAKRHTPENLVASLEDIDKVLEEKATESLGSYPFSTLQALLRGIRPGETVLFKAQEGIGKTEVMGAIEYHLLQTTKHNIGIIHLEESVKRSLHRFANYYLGYPVHLDATIPLDVIKNAVHSVIGEERVHLYRNFGSENLDAIINTIRFLVANCGCRFIFLDHISRLVSGSKIDDERKALDYISTRLSQLAAELNFALIMVSHVNDDGQTRGSRNISKEAFSVISLSRDLLNPDPVIRNTTTFTIEKNRTGSATGPGGQCFFDPNTFLLSETPPKILAPV